MENVYGFVMSNLILRVLCGLPESSCRAVESKGQHLRQSIPHPGSRSGSSRPRPGSSAPGNQREAWKAEKRFTSGVPSVSCGTRKKKRLLHGAFAEE